jgi:hypothetical protein
MGLILRVFRTKATCPTDGRHALLLRSEAAIGAAKAAVTRAPRIILRLGARSNRRRAEKDAHH